MTESRPYASLTSSLLARKGGAKPAMRPRPFTHESMLDDLGWDDMGDSQPNEHVPSSIAGLTPAPRAAAPASREEPAPVHMQQRVLAESFGEPDPVEPEPVEPEPVAERTEPHVLPAAVVTALRAPKSKASGSKRKAQGFAGGRKAAFTLRLDADRHLRLRLATALTSQSAQQLVTSALDQFMESMPEVNSLVHQLPSRAGKNS